MNAEEILTEVYWNLSTLDGDQIKYPDHDTLIKQLKKYMNSRYGIIIAKEGKMAGFLNEQVQEWYKNNTDLLGVIEKLTNRCKKLEEENDRLKDENEILKDEFDIKVKVVKEQNDYICKINKRCGELEKKADLANADAMNWQHKFFVESAKYDKLIDTASKLDLENAKLQRTIKKYEDEMNSLFLEADDMVSQRDNAIFELETVEKELSSVKNELEKRKNEVRKLNAACQVKSVKIESLKRKLADKDIRIANNVTKPYVPDNDYYRVENLWAVLGGMCKGGRNGEF